MNSLSVIEHEKVQSQEALSSLVQERDQLMEKASKASEVVLELQEKLNQSENDMKAIEHQVKLVQAEKEQLEAQVTFYQPQVEQLQNQLQLAEQQCQLFEKRMNETSEAGSFAAVPQIEGQQLESRQAAQPVDTWAQLAPAGPVSEMQGGGGWAPHVWGQADDSAASFFDQPLQPAVDNATAAHTEFFDSPQVQQSQVSSFL